MGSHHQFLPASQLQPLTALDQQIATLDGEVERRLAPLADTQALTESHPGIGKRTAETVLSEIGPTVGALRPSQRGWISRRAITRVLANASQTGPFLATAVCGVLVEAGHAAGRTQAT